MPRWTPPSSAPSLEASLSCKKQAASLAVVVPDAAQAEGPGSEALSSPSGPPEPAAGTPDGALERGLSLESGQGTPRSPFPSASSSHAYFLRMRGDNYCPFATFYFFPRMKKHLMFFNGQEGLYQVILFLIPGNVFLLRASLVNER